MKQAIPFFSLLAVLLLGCKTSKNTGITEDALLLRMKRTACFGTCPIYTVSFYESGKMKYEGERFIEPLGCHQSQLDAGEMKYIKEALSSFGLEKMEAFYPIDRAVPTDLPSTIISFNRGGNMREITDKGGEAPEKLRELQNKIDEIWKNKKLQSCDKTP